MQFSRSIISNDSISAPLLPYAHAPVLQANLHLPYVLRKNQSTLHLSGKQLAVAISLTNAYIHSSIYRKNTLDLLYGRWHRRNEHSISNWPAFNLTEICNTITRRAFTPKESRYNNCSFFTVVYLHLVHFVKLISFVSVRLTLCSYGRRCKMMLNSKICALKHQTKNKSLL